MYYAACCCGNSAPICGCGDYRYASVQFAIGERDINPIELRNHPDQFCSRSRNDFISDVTTVYSEAKVFMVCGYGGGLPGTYRSNDMPNQFLRYDPESLVVLYSEAYSRFRVQTNQAILNCCDPPGPYCPEADPPFHPGPGTHTSITTKTGSLLPFDPLDMPPGTGFSPSATTYVQRGDLLKSAVPVEFHDRIDDATFYRKTTAGISFRAILRRYTFVRDAFFPELDGETVEDVIVPGGGFGGGGSYIRFATQISEIGLECDSHSVGSPIVTYSSSSELPAVSINYSETDQSAGPYTFSIPCCDGETTFGPTYGTTATTISQELDGGIFNLEFFNEPPPEVP